MKNEQKRYLTPTEIATRLRVSPEKVLNWIRKAELRAVNVGEETGRRLYRVNPDDLEDFLKSREVQPPPRRIRHRRETQPEGGPLDPELGKKLLKQGKAVFDGKKYYRVWNGITLYF